MTKTYRAMLTFLEELGAEEIIGYGRSMGGGVQGEGLKEHTLKEGIRCLFIQERTFSKLSEAAADITCRILGWNIDATGEPVIPQ